VGYVYHIAGEINLAALSTLGPLAPGSKSNNSYIIDNAPAFENTAIPGAIVGATLSVPPRLRWTAREYLYLGCWKHKRCG